MLYFKQIYGKVATMIDDFLVFKELADKFYLEQSAETKRSFDYIVLELLKSKRFCFTLTLEEIGYLYGISRERVRQIQDNALRKLRNNKDRLCVSL